MTRTVLFDLGNTLVSYYERPEFPAILAEAIDAAGAAIGCPIPADLADRVRTENYTAKDYRVRPLEARLQQIFAVPPDQWTEDISMAACRAFMAPIFALARLHDDSRPCLSALRERGIRTAIVSNTPWGSPATLWREELARLGLDGAVDAAFFCRDCGWRKPARAIFDHVLSEMNAVPHECLFVGDDPRWDIAGPEAVGIRALLIDRSGRTAGALTTLTDLPAHLPSR